MSTIINNILKRKPFPFTPSEACKTTEVQNNNLIADIQLIRRELATARSRFDFETDFELVEASIYHISALETRYNHLIKLAKRIKTA